MSEPSTTLRDLRAWQEREFAEVERRYAEHRREATVRLAETLGKPSTDCNQPGILQPGSDSATKHDP